MHMSLYLVLAGAGIFAGMMALFYVGRALARREKSTEAVASRAGLGPLDGAVLALLGLLIAFAFSGAAARFDQRRQQIIEEANCIGTAWLRIDVLPLEMQPEMRDLFRRYMDTRLETYRKLPDEAAAMESVKESAALQTKIWARATPIGADPAAALLKIVLLPALNQMFDIMATRMAMRQIHAPTIIFVTLVLVAFLSALISGHSITGHRPPNWIHVACFAAAIALVITVILDLEYPRIGLIREDAADALLLKVRASMG